jgi:hypothetical protein
MSLEARPSSPSGLRGISDSWLVPVDECGCVFYHGYFWGDTSGAWAKRRWNSPAPSLRDASTWQLYQDRCLVDDWVSEAASYNPMCKPRRRGVYVEDMTNADLDALTRPFLHANYLKVILIGCGPSVRAEYRLHHSYAQSASVQHALQRIKLDAWRKGRAQLKDFSRRLVPTATCCLRVRERRFGAPRRWRCCCT